MSARLNLLYVYAQRHPKALRELVMSYIDQGEFNVERMHYETPEPEMCRKMAWADAVLMAPGRHLPDRVIAAGTHVKLIQVWSSGYDKINLAGATSNNIPVANNGGANRIAVAEHTILLMLAVYKKLPDSHWRTVNGRWDNNSHGMDMFLLYRKTLGILGLGSIGRAVAERARCFGMRVIYFDPQRATCDTERALGIEYMNFRDVVQHADILTPHLHLDPETHGLIGEREIGMMKEGAVIINVSRGELVDTDSVYEALRSGHLHGAGFDVYAKEPTKAGDPLLNHPHVVCTPHMACTYDTHVMALEAALQNIRRVGRGEAPHWVVNGLS